MMPSFCTRNGAVNALRLARAANAAKGKGRAANAAKGNGADPGADSTGKRGRGRVPGGLGTTFWA